MANIKNILLENEAVNQMNLDLEAENKELQEEITFLRKQNRALKLRCSKYCLENKKLEEEIQDMRFTRKYLTSEEAGRQFAKELLGGA